MPGMFLFVVLQIAFGSIVLLYLDEVVSKHGIGSGIGLFIAAGVSQTIIWRFLHPPFAGSPQGGDLWQFVSSIATGADFILLLPMIFSIIVFLVVVYAEGMHVNIPLTIGRGIGSRFPVKLLYVSNIPVILAVALFANIQLWAAIAPNIPSIGKFIAPAFSTIASFTQPQFGLFENVLRSMAANGLIEGILFLMPQITQAIVYIIILVVVCIIFGRFWVEMGGQGPEAVAEQLQKSGMYIPGFRRDKRVIKTILNRYIPPITIIGSAFVGLLAGFADLTGALGSGTGILLTVGIVYRLYEELAKEQLLESNVLMKKLFGG
jgi:preprotein translocase subunit SecY